MSDLAELRKAKLAKLKELKKAGINPYPSESKRTHTCLESDKGFSNLEKSKKEITLAGRLMSLREHGKLTFANLQDESGKFQLAFKKDHLDDQYKLLKKLDIGDFLQVTGTRFKTRLGEKTLDVKEFTLLSKSLRPLPEKWHGLKDQELKYRKRYLDLIMNEKSREVFHLRSKLIDALRDFLTDKGFLEVETPVLQPIPGGTSAKPFITHHNTLDTDFYLRIAPELYLKRLIVGGFEKIFEIGRNFRNEGISTIHNPDFTMLEFYQAMANYEDLMKLTEEMFSYIVKRLKISGEHEYQEYKINFKTPWERITFTELLKKEVNLDITKVVKRDELAKFADKLNVKINSKMGADKIIDEIFKKKIRSKIAGPLFVTNYPLFLSPLAKRRTENSEEVEQYQLILGGFEVIKAYSELNDPIDQRERFEEQLKLHEMGDEEAQLLDEDFVEALEYGMPPTAGFGLGIDRLVMVLANTANIRDVILFPVLKPKKPAGVIAQDKVGTGKLIPKKEALKLLNSKLKNPNLIKHTLAVEACMRALAKKLAPAKAGDKNIDEEVYGIAGLLHDLDYEETAKTPEKHTLKTEEWLKKEGIRDDIIQSIKAHNEACGSKCETTMDYALKAIDPTTGLIVACALVMPDKKLKSVTVDSVMKKFKSKGFAAGASRDQIKLCEKLDYKLEDFIKLCLKAMQGINKELGL